MVWETVSKVDEEEEKPSNWSTVAAVDGAEEPPSAPEKPFSFSEDLAPELVHAIPKGYAKMAAGLGDLPNLASTLGTWPQRKVLNTLGVPEEITNKAIVPAFSESETMTTPRESLDGRSINELLDKTEGVEEGDFADYAQMGVEWGGLGPISALRKSASAAPDVAMGLLAPAGAWVGDQLSEAAGTWGEVAGGLTGLATSLRKGKGIDDAVRVIKENMWGNPDEVIEEVSKRVDDKEAGTLADLSADQGLFDLEAATVGGPRRQNYVETEVARQQQIADEIRKPFGEGDPKTSQAAARAELDRRLNEVIPKYVQSRQNRVEVPLRAEQEAARAADEVVQSDAVAALENQANAQQSAGVAAGNTLSAARAAEEAQLAMATDEPLANVAVRASDTWNTGKADARARDVQPKWDEFDAIESTDYAPYRNAVNDFVDGLPESQKVEIKANPKIDGLLRPFRNKDITEMKPKQIQKYLEQIKKEIDSPTGGTSSAAHDDLRELYNGLREQLGSDVPIYNDAMAAEAKWKTDFDVGGVVDDAASGAPELFFRAAGEGDEASAVVARIVKAADVSGLRPVVGDRLRSLARRYKVGVPDEQFILEYESIMDSLTPEVRAQAQSVIDTGRGLESAGASQKAADEAAGVAAKEATATATAAEASTANTAAEVKRLEKAIAEQQKDVAKTGTKLERSVARSNMNKYVKDPAGTLRKMLKNPNDISDLNELWRNMERLGEGESFNAQIGEAILETLSDTTSGNAGLRLSKGEPLPLKADAIMKFENIAESLLKAGSDPAAIQEMRKGVLKLATSQQKAAARSAMMNREHVLQNIVESGASALGLKLAPGSSLVWSGTIRKAVRSLMGRGGKRDKDMMAAIDDFMLNPENYLEAVLAAESPAKAQQTLISKLVAFSQANQAFTGE